MAKCNDGNYLQHAIEVAAAVQLAALGPAGRLHVALAHGMAPFEPCEEPKGGRARRLLKRAINESYRPAQPIEAPIVAAYRSTGATFTHYPNSAELLRRSIETGRLTGGITETNAQRYEALAEGWKGSRVVTRKGSWRSQIGPNGVLECPASLDSPWLFALDPMTYREDGQVDDDKLYRADLLPLAATLGAFVGSGQPGVAAVFVYAVEPTVSPMFWRFADDLASRIGAAVVSGWVAHYRESRNLAALLYSGFELSSRFLPEGIESGR